MGGDQASRRVLQISAAGPGGGDIFKQSDMHSHSVEHLTALARSRQSWLPPPNQGSHCRSHKAAGRLEVSSTQCTPTLQASFQSQRRPLQSTLALKKVKRQVPGNPKKA